MSMGKYKAMLQNKKMAAALLSLLLILAVSAGATIAYLTSHTGDKVNTFTPGEVQTEIVEDFDGEVKEDVFLKNTGDTEAYLRAAVVVTWKDSNGNVHAAAPVQGKDYEMILAVGTGWFQAADGYYYYSRPVPAGEQTGILIDSCKPLAEKEGYVLSVEIIGSAIQSSPAKAVENAWGVSIDAGGVLSK